MNSILFIPFLEELYRRVLFNICVGNTDDHFQNHGFLLTPKGWILSPVYDVNPKQELSIFRFRFNKHL